MKTGVIAAVLHELLKTDSFTTTADLTEVLKCRCARLRVPYDAGRIAEALNLVARTRPLLAVPKRPDNKRVITGEAFMSCNDAARIVADLVARYQREVR